MTGSSFDAPMPSVHPGALIHPTAVVDGGASIGDGTKVWRGAHLRSDTVVGIDCVIGSGAHIGVGTRIGDQVKVQNNCQVFGAVLEDRTMLAPAVILVEDPRPRATTPTGISAGIGDWQRHPVTIRYGATVGASAVVAPGTAIGRHALVAVGSVVHRDVPDHALVAGNPARQVGWVCICAHRLDDSLTCPHCRLRYTECAGGLRPADQ